MNIETELLEVPNYTSVPPLPTASHHGIQLSDFAGPPLARDQHIEPGTGTASGIGYLLVVGGLLLGTLVTWGAILLLIPIGFIMDFFNRQKIMAALHGSGLQVNQHQLPEVYQAAVAMCRRMGLEKVPDIYVVEGNVINAVAARVGARKVVVLIDDIVDACLRTGNHNALAFLLAHELAHHAYGHTGMLRAYVSAAYKGLSRKDEFTCDSAAAALTGKDAAFGALGVMLTGPQLLPYVNHDAVAAQAREVEANKHSKKAERKMTHPLLLRRIARFC